MSIKKALLYYHTIKYLKPIQIWHRLIRISQQLRFYSFPKKVMPKVSSEVRGWEQIIFPKSPIVEEYPLTFSLLNQQGIVAKEADWNNPAMDKLWLYNLHYMTTLLSDIAPELKKKIIHLWISQNPMWAGVGWEPYPLSLRIVNWIKYALSAGKQDEEFNKSLYFQCLTLERTIEYHLLGNHLFENAKALIFAGLYFDTKDSKRWLNTGISILKKQLKEQVLDDGGHFERSPMYHSIILEGVLDLYQLTLRSYKVNDDLQNFQKQLCALFPDMINWLKVLSHHDKQIAFFNDSTFGIAPEPEELYAYARMLGFQIENSFQKLTFLEQSGIIRAETQEILVLADVGSLGPSYIPGHAHAGTLSFEMSLGGKRFFVNRGISTYNSNKERFLERSTVAHNTVSIEDENSSQVWSSFRVAQRARVFDVKSDLDDSRITFSAAHDGYHRLASPVTHRRRWVIHDKKILIEDKLSGKGSSHYRASFHLHPDWIVEGHGKTVLNVISTKTNAKVNMQFPEHSDIRITPYDYAIGFNNKIKGWCISVINSNTSLPHTLEIGIEW